MTELSPCLHCTRTKDPQNCENKHCRPWREWFITRWEQTRKLYRQGMDQVSSGRSGVPLGGHRYDSPHRTMEYLQTDPCTRCKLPSQLCDGPCRVRTVWEQTRKKVHDELEK